MNQIQYSHVAGDFEFGRYKSLPRCCKALEIDFLLWPGSTRICIDCMEWWWLQQKGCSSGLCQQSPFQFESFDGSISKINFVTELKKYTPEVSSPSSDYFQKLCLVHQIHWFGCKRILSRWPLSPLHSSQFFYKALLKFAFYATQNSRHWRATSWLSLWQQ